MTVASTMAAIASTISRGRTRELKGISTHMPGKQSIVVAVLASLITLALVAMGYVQARA